jgi:hypothetical protein
VPIAMEYGTSCQARTSVGGLQKCIIPATVAHTFVASEVMAERDHGELMCLCFTWLVYSILHDTCKCLFCSHVSACMGNHKRL